ncbi:uncharacterized protein LOC129189438 isoform X2 [Dunckerocampus dactyliophorus]|uniref:uncharacterized protein LOC129189438 isoform X2 n=1 Tax=Dunckerocampus dactyliophorus TaxID=161453 RepID=UPI002405CF26|nr:uncharacterized protein LOC129189438 isoform X2 [Dunckerocampus dactyliophorus]
MFPTFLFACLLCVSFAIEYEELCYGRSYRFPFQYSPPIFTGKIYFTPRNRGSRRLVFDNGEAKHPRLKVTATSLSMRDLREQDEGTFSVPFGSIFYDFASLKILECAEDAQRYYNGLYRINLPYNVDILEFTPMGKPDQTRILWNRTSTQTSTAGRGQLKKNSWEVSEVRPKDNGYYNLREKSQTLVSRKKLTVKEYTENYKPKEGTTFFLPYPNNIVPWHITFSPSGPGGPIKLMASGKLKEDINYDDRLHFGDRLYPENTGLEIAPVESKDSGVFEFRDEDHQLMFVANVEVEEVAMCCCCIRRCCCKKGASKTNVPQTTATAVATPAVYYHGPTQPAATGYSATPPVAAYSYQAVTPARAATPPPAVVPPYQPYNPVSAREPAPDSSGPPVYNMVVIHPSPTQPEAAVLGGHDSVPATTLGFSSDPGPRFELKGMNIPSALSSDTTVSNVYTSDKLNFM